MYIIISIILLIIFTFSYIVYAVSPLYMSLVERKADSIAISISNKAINDVIKDIDYSDLIQIEKDSEGKISLIKANTNIMNTLSRQISDEMEEELNNLQDSYIFIPLGSVFGNKIFMNVGPKIKVKLLPSGGFKTNFKSEFSSTGINQTSHKIYVEIICNGTIITPFSNKTSSFTNEIVISEVIIVGNVPTTFYNLEGIEGMQKDDTMNVMN